MNTGEYKLASILDCDSFWKVSVFNYVRRSQVVREVTRKIAEIQNAALGEHRIRDLNDEINRYLREKGRWEDRIKEVI